MSRKIIARLSITVTLAYILGLFDLFKLPQGGGVSLESLPLMIFAFIEGPVYAMLAGLIYGLLMLSKPSAFIHPVQFFLDYPLAFSSFFVIGFLHLRTSSFYMIFYALAAFFLRFICHFLSGLIFCSVFIPSANENILKYVVFYNISYLIPTALLCIFLYFPIARKLKTILHP